MRESTRKGQGAADVSSRLPRRYWIVLILMIVVGAYLRFHHIGRSSLSLDEYWGAYLATGNGGAALNAPSNTILDPPPANFQQAKAVWHIWTGLESVPTPPLYYLVLRGWVDIFGSSDVAMRSLAAMCSLAAIFVLFDILRQISEPWVALFASGIMVVAPIQIDLSQEVRAYTLLSLLLLLCIREIVQIERHGPTRKRAIALGVLTAAVLLTHYFAIGAVAGVVTYVGIRFKGTQRRSALIAVALAVLFVFICWGPFAYQLRNLSQVAYYMREPRLKPLDIMKQMVLMPHRMVLSASRHVTWAAAIPLAILVYGMPLLLARRRPTVWLWWLVCAGSVGWVAAIDLIRHSSLLSMPRYAFVPAPAVYALLALPLPVRSKIRWAAAPIILLCAVIFGVDRLLIGGETKDDLRDFDRMIDRAAAPSDVLVFAVNGTMPPQMKYLAFAHYVQNSRRKVMFAFDPLGPSTLAQLARHHGIWVIGIRRAEDTQRLFPGWTSGNEFGFAAGPDAWQVYSPQVTAP